MKKDKKPTILIIWLIVSSSIINISSFAQENRSFLLPPQLIKNPSTISNYSAESRKFSGIPSLAVSSNGRFWATWYAGTGPGEDQNNYVIVSTSEDKGQSWQEVLVVDPDGNGPVRAFDPELWIDPEGKLWLSWAQSIDNKETSHDNGINTGVWSITSSNADKANPEWSEPRRLTDGIMMCKPTVLSGGEWVLPASTWKIKNGARAVLSTDQGKSWHLQGAVNVPEEVWNCDEHMIIEKKDGSLWMLVRTIYGIGESFSYDLGKTWSPLIPSKIESPTARFFIRRLQSGNLLLVKHGPIEMRTGRSHLMAFISKDDGLSWSRGLLLDERAGISYPDGQQTLDGDIYIIYDYNRTKDQLILMTNFKEEDILSNSDTKLIKVHQHRLVVSKGGPK
jgi:BNR repeat-like domain